MEPGGGCGEEGAVLLGSRGGGTAPQGTLVTMPIPHTWEHPDFLPETAREGFQVGATNTAWGRGSPLMA